MSPVVVRPRWYRVAGALWLVAAGAGSAVRLDLHGRGRVVLRTAQGRSRPQYDELAVGLRAAAAAAGVPVTDSVGSADDR